MRAIDVELKKGKRVRCYKVDIEKAPLIFGIAKNGFAGCGWFNVEVANKLGVAFVKTTGVNTIEEFLEAKVFDFSDKTKKFNIKKGLKIRTALLRLS